MSYEIYLKLNKSGFVIGGYVNKLFASNSVINDLDTKIIKVTLNDANVLTEQEAIKTIKEELKKINKNLT